MENKYSIIILLLISIISFSSCQSDEVKTAREALSQKEKESQEIKIIDDSKIETEKESNKESEFNKEKETKKEEKQPELIIIPNSNKRFDASSMSNDPYSGQIAINNQLYTIPIKVNELEKSGFKINLEKEVALDEFGNELLIKLKEIPEINPETGKKYTKEEKEQIIRDIYLLEIQNSKLNVFLLGKIGVGSSIQDVKKTFGKPIQEKIDEKTESIIYSQYSDEIFINIEFFYQGEKDNEKVISFKINEIN